MTAIDYKEDHRTKAPMLPQSYGGPCSYHALTTMIELMIKRGQLEGKTLNSNFLLSDALNVQSISKNSLNLIRTIGRGIVPNGAISPFIIPSGVSSLNTISSQISKLGLKNEIVHLTAESLVSELSNGQPLMVGYFPIFYTKSVAGSFGELYSVTHSQRDMDILNNNGGLRRNDFNNLISPHYAILTGISPRYTSDGKLDLQSTMIELQESAEVKDGPALRSTLSSISVADLFAKMKGLEPISSFFGFTNGKTITALKIQPSQSVPSFSLKDSTRLTLSTETGAFASGSIENGFSSITSGLSLGIGTLVQLPEGTLGFHFRNSRGAVTPNTMSIHFNSPNHAAKVNIGNHTLQLDTSSNGAFLGLPKETLCEMTFRLENRDSVRHPYDLQTISNRRSYLDIDAGVSKNGEGLGIGIRKYQYNLRDTTELHDVRSKGGYSVYKIYFRKDCDNISIRVGCEVSQANNTILKDNGCLLFFGFTKRY